MTSASAGDVAEQMNITLDSVGHLSAAGLAGGINTRPTDAAARFQFAICLKTRVPVAPFRTWPRGSFEHYFSCSDRPTPGQHDLAMGSAWVSALIRIRRLACAHATQKVAVYENEVRGAVSIAPLVEIETPYPVLFSGQPSTPMTGLRCAPRSAALLVAWQSWHSGCKLLMASVPPCCSGTM